MSINGTNSIEEMGILEGRESETPTQRITDTPIILPAMLRIIPEFVQRSNQTQSENVNHELTIETTSSYYGTHTMAQNNLNLERTITPSDNSELATQFQVSKSKK